MTHTSGKTFSIATRFTVIFSVVVALILPFGYFIVSYQYLMGIIKTEAEINSEFVSRLISANPELWRYETIRVEELLGRRPRSGTPETRRIFDRENVLVAESINSVPSPEIKVSHDVVESGEVAGRIEISRSMLPLLLKSGILAIFGLGIGLLLYRWLPFQAVIKAGRQLQDANNFLKKIMDGSTNSLVVLDLAGNIRMFNGRFEAVTGCPRDDLLGHPFCNLFAGDALSQVEGGLQNVAAGVDASVTFETVLSRRDGLKLNLFCGAVPLEREGVVSGIVVSLDDITERITAEEERLVLERQLQQAQKLESLGVLAGGIAHDFNNILTIILGFCYVIKDEGDSAAPKLDYIQKIEDAANRASDICRQMLSYSGKNELLHSPIEMNALVNDLVKMLSSGIKKNVTIDLHLGGVLVIISDSSQIQQIVMNLIINAAEAIGDNIGTIRISVTKVEITAEKPETDVTGKTIPAGRYVCLEVSDNGCGMNKETQDRIFEPFYTTKFAGRGLGMSSTLGIIKSHDGALQLSSKPDAGSTFRVYLPMPTFPDTAEIIPAPWENPYIQGNGTVLLVDDEKDLRVLGPIRLKAIGFSALTASNGREALEIYRERGDEIDLVLLDLLMPEMDGIETYHRLREISRTIPIVFCSGCRIEELPSGILDDEHTDFLKKPFKPEQLQNTFAYCIVRTACHDRFRCQFDTLPDGVQEHRHRCGELHCHTHRFRRCCTLADRAGTGHIS
jgi:two-component system, cell cycle sensor histidine kinase and response regulator CckA